MCQIKIKQVNLNRGSMYKVHYIKYGVWLPVYKQDESQKIEIRIVK